MNTKPYKRKFVKLSLPLIVTLNFASILKAETEITPPSSSSNQTTTNNLSVNQSEPTPSSPWFRKDRWALTMDFGYHFKQLNFIDNDILRKIDAFPDRKNGRKFWGESGISASYGFAYKRILENKKWFWGSRIVWIYFFPDQRWNEKGTEIALSFVPLIGNYTKTSFENAPAWLSMLIIPIVYFDFGYITDNNISFSLGSVYLWGLSPTVEIPLKKNLDLEIRSVIFLDKVFIDIGYHNLLMSIGINWKPWNY